MDSAFWMICMHGINGNGARPDQSGDRMRHDHATHLLLRIASSDDAAFSQLYRMTSARLRAVAAKILKDGSDAEDVLQDAYLKIWNKAWQYDPKLSSPLTWMSRVVTNTALDALRAARPAALVELDAHAESIADTAISSLARLESDEQMHALIAAIEALPSNRKELVKLAYFQGQSREALAQRFDAPTATVKTWLRRTLLSVREVMETETGLRDRGRPFAASTA